MASLAMGLEQVADGNWSTENLHRPHLFCPYRGLLFYRLGDNRF